MTEIATLERAVWEAVREADNDWHADKAVERCASLAHTASRAINALLPISKPDRRAYLVEAVMENMADITAEQYSLIQAYTEAELDRASEWGAE